ncbi:hypothetical protein KKB99_06170 [bacterium]|nr:hypothetical protein [bacterium]MBU1025573.1 hypothetical protein [bacterium]
MHPALVGGTRYTVRDQQDYNNCVDYVNFNPVKHGYVTEPREWEHSSFHEYVKRGIYTQEKEFKTDLVVHGAEYD